MIFFHIHDSRRLLITYSFNDVLIGYLRNGKTGNKKRAICFATWLQNELNSDVARFTTHENKPCNLISCKTGSNIGHMPGHNVAIQLSLQQSCKTSCTCFVARFKYCSFSLVLYGFFGVQTSVSIQIYVNFGPLFLGIIIHFVQVWSFFVTEH